MLGVFIGLILIKSFTGVSAGVKNCRYDNFSGFRNKIDNNKREHTHRCTSEYFVPDFKSMWVLTNNPNYRV